MFCLKRTIIGNYVYSVMIHIVSKKVFGYSVREAEYSRECFFNKFTEDVKAIPKKLNVIENGFLESWKYITYAIFYVKSYCIKG